MKRTFVDERTEHINGLVSFFCLMLTQLALVGVLLYKRYFLGLPPEAYAEIAWIAVLSMAVYWAVRLYLSGILPVISFKKMLVVYIVLVAAIFIPTYFIHGWPVKEHWYEVLYPFLGVAVILGFYSLVAYLGKRRLEKLVEQ
jgi:ABC-type transport system involved in cytochrome c biogenesis permease subunit